MLVHSLLWGLKVPDNFVGPLPPGFVGPLPAGGLPTVGAPTVGLPSNNLPTVNQSGSYYLPGVGWVNPQPQLPDWVPPTQVNNPSSQDINSIATTVGERTLSLSPWGTYVPLVFGEDVIGPIISLAHVRSRFLYLRLVWCVGEIEEIVSVTNEDGTPSGATLENHYLGTSTQGVDPILSNIDISGYADTMRGIGPDDVNLAYSVLVFDMNNLQGFPRLVARIKGMKVTNPVPNVKLVVAGAGGGSSDEVTYEGTQLYAEDTTGNGQVVPFIRYEEDELIDNEEYTFEIEVTDIDGNLTSITPQFCDITLIDDDDNPISITGLGTYKGRATRATYDSTYNHFKAIINGDPDIAVTMNVFGYNSLGNSVPAYSNLASSILNYLITNPTHGLGASVDLQSYLSLSNRNLGRLGTSGYWEKRSVIGLSLTRQQQLSKVIEVVRGYARTNLAIDNGVYKFFPLQPATETFTLTDSDIFDFKPNLKDLRNLPNVVRVYYTDTTETPWKDNFVEVVAPEVTSGDEFRRVARYNMPGIQTKTAALRYAYDQINQRLRTFKVTFKAREKVYDKLEGENFTLNVEQLGNVDYKMKMFKKKLIAPGTYQIYAEKEDDNLYSNEIADFDPGNGTIGDPNPTTVIDATGLTLAIETPRFETGVYYSRIRATWTATTYDYNHRYDVKLYEVGTPDVLIGSLPVAMNQTEAVFPSIQEGNTYRLEVKVLGFGGIYSTGISETIVADGKSFPPTNVPFLNAANNNGRVFLTWGEATDNEEIVRYSIQYGPSGFAWDDDTARLLIARIDSESLVTENVPEGIWDFLIKAVDNAFNESADATRFEDLVVEDPPSIHTINSNIALGVDSGNSIGITPVLSERLTFNLGRFPDAYHDTILDYAFTTADTWAVMFPNAMNTYNTDPFITGGTGAFSLLNTTQFDAGKDYFGVWSIDPESDLEVLNFNVIEGGHLFEHFYKNDTPENIKNRVKVQIQLSSNGFTWQTYDSMYVKATARYMRVRMQTTDPAKHTMIFRRGFIKGKLQVPVKEQTYNYSWTSGSNTVTLNSATDDILSMTVAVVDSALHFATIEPVGSAPYSQVQISVFTNKGAAATGPVQVSGLLRYI